jgi:hypothetical protein
MELLAKDEAEKNPALYDIYELFESRVNFHGFDDV